MKPRQARGSDVVQLVVILKNGGFLNCGSMYQRHASSIIRTWWEMREAVRTNKGVENCSTHSSPEECVKEATSLLTQGTFAGNISIADPEEEGETICVHAFAWSEVAGMAIVVAPAPVPLEGDEWKQNDEGGE